MSLLKNETLLVQTLLFIDNKDGDAGRGKGRSAPCGRPHKKLKPN